eukprot:gene1688-biopygen1671
MVTPNTGIFGILDDECSLGSGTDDNFLAKVMESFKGRHPFFDVKKLSKQSFQIHHYAATVNYTVENWLDKNRDTLKPAMKLLMRASEHELIKTLLPEPVEGGKPITVGGFFKQQLHDMMELINSTNPHWIRCVKPHPAKKPLLINGITMMQQLESSGVLGTVKIRKVLSLPPTPSHLLVLPLQVAKRKIAARDNMRVPVPASIQIPRCTKFGRDLVAVPCSSTSQHSSMLPSEESDITELHIVYTPPGCTQASLGGRSGPGKAGGAATIC